MRVNIYAEEMTDKVELIEKTNKDGTFTGIRFWLELPVTQPVNHPHLGVVDVEQVKGPFMHHPGDNDSAAVTFWGKAQLKVALRKALNLLGDEVCLSNLDVIATNLLADANDTSSREIRGYGSSIRAIVKRMRGEE